ncbi:MAG: microcin ABC transporter ATP-binding protein, partial [Bordetella sp.]|nr:microcin ABC transporter ATP-binding protein [Bordetella sp.]
PVSALDVSIQAQVLDLLARISDQLHLSVLFITHDLRVAAQICDRIAVMRQGELVELNRAQDIFYQPQHEYTRRLIASIPGQDWSKPVFDDAPGAPQSQADAARSTQYA